MSDINKIHRAYKKIYLTEASPAAEPAPAATAKSQQMAQKVETDIKKAASIQPERPNGRLKFDDFDAMVAGQWEGEAKPPGSEDNIGTWNGYKTLVLDLMRAYHSNPKENLLVYGDAGIGKSATVLHVAKQMAAEEGLELARWNKPTPGKQAMIDNPEKYFGLWDVRTAGLEPSDIYGIPDLDSAKEYLVTKQLGWVWSVSRPGARGFLFFDELNQGSPQVLKAFFEVIYDHAIGGTPMSSRICICAAGNLGRTWGNVPIPPALTDRFSAGFLIVDAKEWLHWAEGGVAYVPPAGSSVPEEESEENHSLDQLIIGFVKSDPEDNFSFRPVEGSPSSKLPTPRSMTRLSWTLQKLYKDYKHAGQEGIHMPESLMAAMGRKASHICGPDWANRFMAYVQHVRTLTIQEIIEHTKRGEFGTNKKYPGYREYIGAGKQHAILQWFTNKLEKTALKLKAGNAPTPEDIETLVAVAIVSNDLAKQAPEWLGTLWSTFKYTMPQAWVAIMEFLENGNYDPAVKQQFIQKTVPQMRHTVTKPENISWVNGQPTLPSAGEQPAAAPVAAAPKRK